MLFRSVPSARWLVCCFHETTIRAPSLLAPGVCPVMRLNARLNAA